MLTAEVETGPFHRTQPIDLKQILPQRRKRMGVEERIRFAENPERFIEKTITKFVLESPANRRKADDGKYWDTPLVGFAFRR